MIDGVLVLLFFTVAIIEFSVGYGIFSANFATPIMATRCRDSLSSSAKLDDKFGPGKILFYKELTASENWTDNFEHSLKCDNSSSVCESGYLWSAPVNAKHGFESIHYRLFLLFFRITNIFFVLV